MKKRYITVLSLSALLFLGSCGEDFLYKSPQGSLDSDALTNATGVEMLTINAYAALAAPVDGYDPYQASPFNWVFGGMYGGDANKGSNTGDQATLNEVEIYKTLSTNDYLRQKWGWVYSSSKRVNTALQILAKVEDMNEDIKKTREGELKFLRGLIYFEGTRVFGKFIPYFDESFTDNDPKAHNDKDISSNVLADIDAAIAALPNTQQDVGRANVWAAKALKAKALMYYGKVAEAQPVLKELLESGVTSNGLPYGLEDDLNANWDATMENGKESIFAVQYSNSAQDMGNAAFCLNYPHNTGPGGCCGFYQPSQELANSFQVDANGLPYLNGEYRNMPTVTEPTGDGNVSKNNASIAVDPRLDFTVGRLGIPYKDWGMPETGWIRDPSNGGVFMPKKHVYSKHEADAKLTNLYGGWAPGSAMNMQYLSVRDMVLLYAECLANAGDLKGAMEQVNKIRRRAALPVNIIKLEAGTPAANYKISEYPSTHAAFSNKDVCIKAIRMERKLELAMEGERWFDLVRYGGDVMSAELKAYVDYERKYLSKYAAAAVLSPAKTMFPIPDEQIQTVGNDENGQPYLVQPEAWR